MQQGQCLSPSRVSSRTVQRILAEPEESLVKAQCWRGWRRQRRIRGKRGTNASFFSPFPQASWLRVTSPPKQEGRENLPAVMRSLVAGFKSGDANEHQLNTQTERRPGSPTFCLTGPALFAGCVCRQWLCVILIMTFPKILDQTIDHTFSQLRSSYKLQNHIYYTIYGHSLNSYMFPNVLP